MLISTLNIFRKGYPIIFLIYYIIFIVSTSLIISAAVLKIREKLM